MLSLKKRFITTNNLYPRSSICHNVFMVHCIKLNSMLIQCHKFQYILSIWKWNPNKNMIQCNSNFTPLKWMKSEINPSKNIDGYILLEWLYECTLQPSLLWVWIRRQTFCTLITIRLFIFCKVNINANIKLTTQNHKC